MRACVTACLIASATVVSDPAAAQTVTLRATEGGLEVTGQILGFDGEYYRVATEYGELTLDGSRVTCAGESCPDPTAFVPTFTISGADSTGEILFPALIDAFAARQTLTTARRDTVTGFAVTLSDPNLDREILTIEVRRTPAGEGFAELVEQGADAVASFREPTDDERESLETIGLGQNSDSGASRIFALDALTSIAARSNPVVATTLADLAGVLSGDITNWTAFGGADRPISVHLIENGEFDALLRVHILDPFDVSLTSDVVRHPDWDALLEAISADPDSLAVAPYSKTRQVRRHALVGTCGHVAEPSLASLKSEDFPLTQPHFLFVPEGRRVPRPARQFLDYLQSPFAQPVVRRAGFVDQAPLRIPLSEQGLRLARAIENAGPEIGVSDLRRLVGGLTDAERLTTTFRFLDGSVDLDAQSRSNIGLLAAAVDRGTYNGQTLVFAGFSDGVGGASENQRLSLRRAEAVLEAVRDAAGPGNLPRIRFVAEGYGEAMPLACDEDYWGRHVNRRVEVWLR
ncbi:MAG: phosphate ABC transporter substrate-binding/OmpA family protein [Pseudomonadota bacterium]